MVTRPPVSTKTTLLDAAERLFAERGIDGTSLRAITGQARANVAAVNYYFGSKRGLVQAVFARRLRPLNQQRLQLLGHCRRDNERSAELRQILHAFVDPVLTMLHSREAGNRHFVRLMGRLLAEPESPQRSMILNEFEEVIESFSAALARALPQLSPVEIAWRFHFMVGAMAHTVAASQVLVDRLQQLELPEPGDIAEVSRRLVGFLESGWRAPPLEDGPPQGNPT